MVDSKDLNVAYDLLGAIVDQDLASVKRLVAEHDWLIADRVPESDDTWLQTACRRKNLALVGLMLDLGFNPSPLPGKSGSYPLTVSVTHKLRQITEMLLARGANPNLDRPLIAAINLNPVDDALTYVKLLVEHGCDLNRIYDLYGDMDNGFTALDWAKDKPAIAEFIRSKGGLTANELRSGKRPPAGTSQEAEESPKTVATKLSQRADDEVIAHFEKTVGPASKKSLIQIVPTGVPIGIHFIPPKGNRKHLTLFTNGLSTEPMNTPEGAEEYRYAELFIELPGDWKIKEVKDMRWAWPLYWLRKMAQYPHNADTWLGGPVTLMANDDPPQPLWPGSKFTTLLLFAESSFQRSDGNTVQLYRMIPLYTSEREYELKHGLKRFMQALDKNEVPFIVDIDRKPFV